MQNKSSQGRGLFSFLWETLLLIVAAFLIAAIIKIFIVQPFYIPSESMMPTLKPGDRLLVNKFIYRFNKPKPGDIVVFLSPTDSKKDYIKRVIAVGDEEIEINDGQVFINNEPIKESYAEKDGDMSDFGPIKIPKGSVFMMGDNRANSSDSRVFGPVKTKFILGSAFATYWPINRVNLIH
ncbi:MAG TPA: signal peptidase I [Actinobacteria bacterium]|nr:signal peptidase I [Actinomycetota bacterium]